MAHDTLKNPYRTKGFTLVEIMIALTIGLILLVVIAQIFVTSRSTYTFEEGMARVQENGRFAMEFLASDIRMAGYMGCSSKLTMGAKDASDNCSTGSVCVIVDPPSDVYNYIAEGIRAYRYTGNGTGANLTDWTPTLPSDYFAANQVRPGTDVIVLQRASSLGTHLTGNTTPSNANVQIITTAEVQAYINPDDILMLSDCKQADIFRATNKSDGGGKTTMTHTVSNPGNVINKLTHSYGNDAELMKLVSRAYYIGTNGAGQPALYRKDLATGGSIQAEELVEGIENMRALYGEDTDTTADSIPNFYRKADSVSSWGRVVSVRIGLLSRTLNNVDQALDTKTYPLPGGTVDPTDDRLRRQVYTSTIQIRN